MVETGLTMQEQYATRVLAAMLRNASEWERFDDDTADEIWQTHGHRIDVDADPRMHNADLDVYAEIDADVDLQNAKTLDLYNFIPAEFHGIDRTDDGDLRVTFVGFRTTDALELRESDRGLLESTNDATKYFFTVVLK